MEINKLMRVANRSKTITYGRDYTMSHVVFAYLLDIYFVYGRTMEDFELLLETNDPEGRDSFQGYYDIAVLRCGNDSLCLPLPLLSQPAMTAVLKRATPVPRKNHVRSYCRAKPNEIRQLWQSVFQMTGSRNALTLPLRHLKEKPLIRLSDLAA